MASSSKRQTTMAKMAREQAVRERRIKKQEKKDSRKQAAAEHRTEAEPGLPSADGQLHPGPPPSE